jgi:DNA-binding NarL/FixJ family response regulator
MRADTKAAPIKVLLVDDNPRFRQVTRTVLTNEEIEVVGEAGDGEEALEKVKGLRPQVVLMDCSMPRMGGAEATRRIQQINPEIRVVGLTLGEDPESLSRMTAAGAVEIVAKGAGPQEISRAIRSATAASTPPGRIKEEK